MKNRLSLRATLKIFFLIAALLISSDNAYALRKLRVLVYPFQNTGSSDFLWLSAGMIKEAEDAYSKAKDDEY